MSTPRYLGSTVAAAKTYVQSTLTTGPFLAIFDMDRDGAVTGDDETVAAHRTHAHKERALEEALTRARHAPAEHLAGEVVRMRARHTLYFSGTSGPCKVLAGREFDASHEELMRAELVEGRDFERVTG